MSKIIPFKGVRPKNDLASSVIAPPYDVLSEEEARAIATKKPTSFIRVTRSEVDLPVGSDSHSEEAYIGAKNRLQLFLDEGTLVQDDQPCFYLYTQTWMGRTQYGLMALCDTEEYDNNLIKKHELTRPDKEQDRTDHINILGAQTGLVFLTYRNDVPEVKDIMATIKTITPLWTVQTDDGVEHNLTQISDADLVSSLESAFSKVPALYIADGHHRSAAASRVAKLKNQKGSSRYFLTGIFPDDELYVMAYNRMIKDLNGLRPEVFLAKISEIFAVTPDVSSIPEQRGTYTMYLQGRWYGLQVKEELRESIIPNDPVGILDVSVLQNQVLAPMLGIENPRTDKRIAFVGGIRGPEFLSQAVDNGDVAVAFHLYPTGIGQLLDVADANALMPPKSTWFEPKLRGGVLIHKLES